MGRIDRLAERYKSFIALPWQKDLAGAERVIFIVYDKADERRCGREKICLSWPRWKQSTIGMSVI